MIEVSHVSRNFGDFRAVNDVSFSIPTGQIVGLLGPNGAGKTTTMRMITGFLAPSAGSVKIDGIDITENPVEAKRKIGYMPESAPLYGEMIVEDYLRYIAGIYGQNPEEKVPLLCKECGLKEVMSKNISELSRGNRQRVALAHALMNDPEILILDEPTSGLDPNQVEDVRSIIREIGKTRTVIVSTHILSEVETICSRAIIISGGKLVADSSIEELKNSIGTSSTVYITVGGDGNKACELVKSINGVAGVTVGPKEGEANLSELVVSVNGDAEIRPVIIKKLVEGGFDLYEAAHNKNTLEDVFHTLTEAK
ncbi:ABC-2 type transport system ATP-binding protein [Treponema bryantii]|uniref:ABC-2 type transport system ATP-binding protein n=1 Tax=Treponema bryantii TaxID=163 RepID=A0A1I3IDE6_9SPIR|nr:ATP-binding cassette domain-containing protein [Treponema bryantii]SFI45900.1 ABC-2 type transport system ATP-binding protein [Treponema bryantii]